MAKYKLYPDPETNELKTLRVLCRKYNKSYDMARAYILHDNLLTSEQFFKMNIDEIRASRPKQPNLTDNPLYRIWFGMIKRCTNINNGNFKQYGAKGITVCNRWSDVSTGFQFFLSDMGERPDKYQLDRIDSAGPYSPENCRWVSQHHNLMNKLKYKRNTSGYKGVSKTKGTYRAAIRYDGQDYVIGTFFKTAEDAAVAYDLASHIFFKEFGVRNFPELSINELIIRNKELFANRLNVKSNYMNILVPILNDHK